MKQSELQLGEESEDFHWIKVKKKMIEIPSLTGIARHL